MSIFHSATLICPHCGSENEIERVASVNAGRRPDLRAAILDRSFQAITCESCAAPLRLPPHLTYVDMARGNWILVEDSAELPNWLTHDAAAKALFDDMFGPSAAPTAREMAAGIRPRIVFGWPALREKIICTELGLDDVEVELLKIAMMRRIDGIPIGGGLSLRLVGGTAESLTFEIINDETEESQGSADIPRGVYDGIAADMTGWAPLRARFAAETLVDTARLTLEG